MLESLQTSVTGLGVVHAAGRATHADHLDGFMGGRIAPRRDIGQIGLSVHQAGDRAVECFWDLEHVQSVVACTTAEVWTGGKRANQDQGCQHQRLPSSRWARPRVRSHQLASSVSARSKLGPSARTGNNYALIAVIWPAVLNPRHLPFATAMETSAETTPKRD